jgi:glycine/serine hydroxymethyltransferase
LCAHDARKQHKTGTARRWQGAVREQALTVRPAVLVCGGSAYPRTIDFPALRAVADEVGALLLGDISHISGLVAAGLHPSPVLHCDVVTTSTYKQLRGPHGGLILRRPGSRLSANEIDKFVFPGFQGTPDFGSGRTVSHALEQVGILANKNLIPNDRRSAHETSGLRLGTNHLAFMDIGEHEVGEAESGDTTTHSD